MKVAFSVLDNGGDEEHKDYSARNRNGTNQAMYPLNYRDDRALGMTPELSLHRSV